VVKLSEHLNIKELYNKAIEMLYYIEVDDGWSTADDESQSGPPKKMILSLSKTLQRTHPLRRFLLMCWAADNFRFDRGASMDDATHFANDHELAKDYWKEYKKLLKLCWDNGQSPWEEAFEHPPIKDYLLS